MAHVSLRHAILGFIGLEPTTGYTLGQRFSGSVGSFWTATQSQIYRELHDLERSAFVEVEVVPQDGKPARKVYTLTPAGEAELQRWLAAPVAPLQLRDPFLLKLVFAAEASPAVVDAMLERHIAELEQTRVEYEARLDMPQIFSLARSERERLLWRLSLENGLGWCAAQLKWAEGAKKRLAGVKPKPRRSRRGKRS
jgi:PadR family transcriptional regulator, regulatory protein AphA